MNLVDRLNNISDDVNWCKELLSLIQEEGYSGTVCSVCCNSKSDLEQIFGITI